jgi:hypothetical protein
MKIGNFKVPNFLIWIVLLGLPLIFVIATYASFNNKEVDLRTTFEMEMKNRTALYDKMWKVISQKAQVTKAYDSSFLRIVQEAMDPRKDGANILMKWVQESNPTLQAGTVQELYKDLSRTIEAERNSFFERETTLSSIQQQHSKFLRRFPNNLYNVFLGRKELEYKPITSGRTDDVIRTGKDDNVDVFQK